MVRDVAKQMIKIKYGDIKINIRFVEGYPVLLVLPYQIVAIMAIV